MNATDPNPQDPGSTPPAAPTFGAPAAPASGASDAPTHDAAPTSGAVPPGNTGTGPSASYPSSTYVVDPTLTEDEKSLAMLAHGASLAATVLSVGSLSFLGPLGIWVWKKDESPFVRQAAARAFNFNVGMWLMALAGVLCFITIVLIPVAVVLWAVAAVASVLCHVFGMLRARDGEEYSYPFRIKILNEDG